MQCTSKANKIQIIDSSCACWCVSLFQTGRQFGIPLNRLHRSEKILRILNITQSNKLNFKKARLYLGGNRFYLRLTKIRVLFNWSSSPGLVKKNSRDSLNQSNTQNPNQSWFGQSRFPTLQNVSLFSPCVLICSLFPYDWPWWKLWLQFCNVRMKRALKYLNFK